MVKVRLINNPDFSMQRTAAASPPQMSCTDKLFVYKTPIDIMHA